MASAFRSASNTTYASRTNTTVTAPAGISDGDVLIYALFLGIAGTPPTPTAPSGFSAPSGGTWPITLGPTFGFTAHVRVWYKIASGEAGNYTATHSAANTQGFMFAVSGGSSSAPVATTNSGGEGPTTTALGLTTSGNDALIAFMGWDWGDTANNLSPPSGTTPAFTERIDVAPLIYLATGVLAAAGATGNKSHTNNSGLNVGSHPWAGVLLAVEASGGGGGVTTAPLQLLLGVGN